MNITKEAGVGQREALTEEELALICAQSRSELKAEEVYTFSVRLCDNEVDREYERFTRRTLEELADLFVGKCGVFDHCWSAKGQVARIYRAEVVEEADRLTAAGEPSCYLKGWAYMLRTEGNRDLIAEIEGGIKKEVSVGCAVEKCRCSICGQDRFGEKPCVHEKGGTYGGKLCWNELEGATDAYEWSFVAVPAQRKAGVIKGLGELVLRQPRYAGELEQLKKEAGLGRRYLEELRRETVRLSALVQPGLDGALLGSIAERMDAEELESLKKACEKRLDELYPRGPQLSYETGNHEEEHRDEMFRI